MNNQYDAIIIGTGIGGGTIGYALAKKGLNILFIDKGSSQSSIASIKGNYAETFYNGPLITENSSILDLAGRESDRILESDQYKIPFIGSGAGGSSALYGMAMERFFKSDFIKRRKTPLNSSSNLPQGGWPISYEELLPYYEKAEKLYNVKGIGDPIRKNETYGYSPPPEIKKANKELLNFFKNKNFNPYVLPRSCDFIANCIECQGFICPLNCKNDSYKMCIKPAVDKYGAKLISNCRVNKFITNNDKITGIKCELNNKSITYKSEIFILAAGAIHSPLILLNSTKNNSAFSASNSSGQVGKNLMRHLIDLFIIKTLEKAPDNGFVKEIAFNDLYYKDEIKLGTFQSFGRIPPSIMLTNNIIEKINNYSKIASSSLELFHPLISRMIKMYFSGKIVMTSIMEDLPYKNNSISFDKLSGRPVLSYHMYEYEQEYLNKFRKTLSNTISPYKYKLIKQAESNKRLAHVCGTCRMGNNPKTSVVNANCRSHDIRNLYIVDSSVFPTSGGTNPALTIAANSLRVSDKIEEL